MSEPPRTPDGRYLVVEGKAGPRLWRASNPHLSSGDREVLVKRLMAARRAVRSSGAGTDDREKARATVDRAKRALGERGEVWWGDGSPDLNRRLVRNTPYCDWWSKRSES